MKGSLLWPLSADEESQQEKFSRRRYPHLNMTLLNVWQEYVLANAINSCDVFTTRRSYLLWPIKPMDLVQEQDRLSEI